MSDRPMTAWEVLMRHAADQFVVSVDPGDIDVDEPLGVSEPWEGLVGIWEPLAVSDTPCITVDEVRMRYERLAESLDVPAATIDINRCSLDEWAARVDALVREVI